MYKFWYGVIRKQYPDAELCFTDTDSLLFHVKTPDFYNDMGTTLKEHLDTSNYKTSHWLHSTVNKAIPGLFKVGLNYVYC